LKVGEPTGGSVTADEYRFATTVVWPVIVSHLHLIHVMVPLLQPQIPIVWDQFQCEATKDFDNANKKYNGQLAAYQQDLAKWEQRQQHPSTSTTTGKGKGKGKAGDDKCPVPPVKPLPRMHEDEPVNFLRLAAALKLLLAQNVNEATILRGSRCSGTGSTTGRKGIQALIQIILYFSHLRLLSDTTIGTIRHHPDNPSTEHTPDPD